MGPKTRKGKIPKLDELHIFPVHLLSQHPVGIFKAQHSQSKLIFPDPSGVTRLFGGKIIFSAIFFSLYFFSNISSIHPPSALPVLVVFLDPGSRRCEASVMVSPVMALARVPGHHVGGGRHHPRPRVAAHPAVAATQVSLVSFTVRTQTRSENTDRYDAAFFS